VKGVAILVKRREAVVLLALEAELVVALLALVELGREAKAVEWDWVAELLWVQQLPACY